MSVLIRPDGDALAKTFGKYWTPKDLKNIKVGDKVDILCTGGVHFVAKVARLDDQLEGKLKFPRHSEMTEYVGSFRALYLAVEGKYSTSEPAKINPATDTKESGRSKYIEGTKYDADFLARPYRENERKRKALDPSEVAMSPDIVPRKRVSFAEDAGAAHTKRSKTSTDLIATDWSNGVSSTSTTNACVWKDTASTATTSSASSTPDASRIKRNASTSTSTTSSTSTNINPNTDTNTNTNTSTSTSTSTSTGTNTSKKSSTMSSSRSNNRTAANATALFSAIPNNSLLVSLGSCVDPSFNVVLTAQPWLPPPATHNTSTYTSGAARGLRINIPSPLYTLDYTTGEICINYENIQHRVKPVTIIDKEVCVNGTSSVYNRVGTSSIRVIASSAVNERGDTVATKSNEVYVRDTNTQCDTLYNTVFARYYADILISSASNQRRNAGKFLQYLNLHIHAHYEKNVLKAPVYGPLGMYIQAANEHVAQAIQHAVPEEMWLTYVASNNADHSTLTLIMMQLNLYVKIKRVEAKLNIGRDLHPWSIVHYMYSSPTILNILAGIEPELSSVIFYPYLRTHNASTYRISSFIIGPRVYSVSRVDATSAVVLELQELFEDRDADFPINEVRCYSNATFASTILRAYGPSAKLIFHNLDRLQQLQDYLAEDDCSNGETNGGDGSGTGTSSAVSKETSHNRSAHLAGEVIDLCDSNSESVAGTASALNTASTSLVTRAAQPDRPTVQASLLDTLAEYASNAPLLATAQTNTQNALRATESTAAAAAVPIANHRLLSFATINSGSIGTNATVTTTNTSTSGKSASAKTTDKAVQSMITTCAKLSAITDAELIARNVNPAAVRALLLAQTKLASALKDLLG